MSFFNGKIVDFLGSVTREDGTVINKVVMELPELDEPWNGMPTDKRISVAHDYVRFHGDCSVEQYQKEDKPYPLPNRTGASNWVKATGSITVHIRDMIEVVLPYLNNHEYLQKEHLVRGSKEPPYAYNACVIHYIDGDKSMVAFRRVGETEYERVSLKLFNQIKDSLELCYENGEQS